MNAMLDRRSILTAAGALVLGFTVPVPAARRALAQGAAAPAAGPAMLTAYLAVMPDGAITLLSPTTEMGQGTWTGHVVIVADEMGADPARIAVENPHPSAPFRRDVGAGPAMGSGGSWGIRYWYTPLREAAARARAMLIAAAAREMGVPEAQLVAENHQVRHAASGRALSFGALAAAASRLTPPAEVTLKTEAQHRLIGRGLPRVDIPDKTRGAAVYSIDFRLPGMVFAYAKLSPVFRGEIQGGVAVVARDMWSAMRGAGAMTMRRKPTAHDNLTSSDITTTMRDGLSATTAAVAKNEGDIDAAFRDAAQIVEQDYEVPFLAHTPMEPFNVNVHIQGDMLEIWAPTQNQDRLVNRVVRDTGWPADKIRLHTMLQGGGYGRRLHEDIVPSAVELARRLNRPVKLFWAREDEIGQGWYRPAQVARLRCALDANKKVIGLHIRTAGTSMQRDFVGRTAELDLSSVQTLTDQRYRYGAYKVDYARRQVPVPCMPWRAVGSTQNGFFVECFLDEVAAAAGKDPVDLRRELLAHDPRALRVINTAAEKSGWGTPLPAGRARGFAFVFSFEALCAQVAEVSIENGQPKVHRVTVAFDCGKVVLPDGVISQIEGGVIQGLSSALEEKIVIAEGRAQNTNFDTYKVLRIEDSPPVIESHILETPGVTMGGVGEPTLPPTTPAVANALSALLGRRIRTLPLTDAVRG